MTSVLPFTTSVGWRIGASALAVLLDQARKKTIRVWAEQSPFDLKDVLKRRGYRWCDGSHGPATIMVHRRRGRPAGKRNRVSQDGDLSLRSGAAIADLDGAQPIFGQSVDRENSRSTSPLMARTSGLRRNHYRHTADEEAS